MVGQVEIGQVRKTSTHSRGPVGPCQQPGTFKFVTFMSTIASIGGGAGLEKVEDTKCSTISAMKSEDWRDCVSVLWSCCADDVFAELPIWS